MMRLAIVVAALLGISGCPRPRPPCGPAREPARPIVHVPSPAACMLPPGPRLAPVRLSPCPPEWSTGGICIDLAQAAALAARLDAMQTWITQAKIACPTRVDAGPSSDR